MIPNEYSDQDAQTLLAALTRLGYTNDRTRLPPPIGVSNGMAGKSRVYFLNITKGMSDIHLVAKFDESARAKEEWKRIEELRCLDMPPAVVLPVDGNTEADRVIIYHAAQALGHDGRISTLSQYFYEQLLHAPRNCVDSLNFLLGALFYFHHREPGALRDTLADRALTWDQVFSITSERIDKISCVLQSQTEIPVYKNIAAEDLLAELLERSKLHIGQVMLSRTHGDLNLTNVLVYTDCARNPLGILIIDLADCESEKVTAVDYAQIEIAYWLDVFPRLCAQRGYNVDQMLRLETAGRDYLDGRSMQPPYEIKGFMTSAIQPLLFLRQHAANILRGVRTTYALEDYYHCLFFLSLLSLRFHQVAKDAKCVALAVRSAVLALGTLHDIRAGLYSRRAAEPLRLSPPPRSSMNTNTDTRRLHYDLLADANAQIAIRSFSSPPLITSDDTDWMSRLAELGYASSFYVGVLVFLPVIFFLLRSDSRLSQLIYHFLVIMGGLSAAMFTGRLIVLSHAERARIQEGLALKRDIDEHTGVTLLRGYEARRKVEVRSEVAKSGNTCYHSEARDKRNLFKVTWPYRCIGFIFTVFFAPGIDERLLFPHAFPSSRPSTGRLRVIRRAVLWATTVLIVTMALINMPVALSIIRSTVVPVLFALGGLCLCDMLIRRLAALVLASFSPHQVSASTTSEALQQQEDKEPIQSKGSDNPMFLSERLTAIPLSGTPSPNNAATVWQYDDYSHALDPSNSNTDHPSALRNDGYRWNLRVFGTLYNQSTAELVVWDVFTRLYHASGQDKPLMTAIHRPRIEILQGNSIVESGSAYAIQPGEFLPIEISFKTSLYDTAFSTLVFGLFFRCHRFGEDITESEMKIVIPSDVVYGFEHDSIRNRAKCYLISHREAQRRSGSKIDTSSIYRTHIAGIESSGCPGDMNKKM